MTTNDAGEIVSTETDDASKSQNVSMARVRIRRSIKVGDVVLEPGMVLDLPHDEVREAVRTYAASFAQTGEETTHTLASAKKRSTSRKK